MCTGGMPRRRPTTTTKVAATAVRCFQQACTRQMGRSQGWWRLGHRRMGEGERTTSMGAPPAAMAAARRPCSGAERLGEVGSGNASEGGMGKLGRSVLEEQRLKAACGNGGGAHCSAWLPRRHFCEHLAGDGVPELGCRFRHIPCRFGSGALKQSCSPLDALKLVFWVQGH